MEDVLRCPKCGYRFSYADGAIDPYAPPVGPIDIRSEHGSERIPAMKTVENVRDDAERALQEMQARRILRQPSPYSDGGKGR